MAEGRLYSSSAEVEEIARRFEACEFEATEFTHAKHLTVATWYLTQLTPEGALERMRVSLRRFSAHHGKMGYHETLTRFWLAVVARQIYRHSPGHNVADLAGHVVAHFADKNLVYEYYRQETVHSDKAKTNWVEPDLRLLVE